MKQLSEEEKAVFVARMTACSTEREREAIEAEIQRICESGRGAAIREVLGRTFRDTGICRHQISRSINPNAIWTLLEKDPYLTLTAAAQIEKEARLEAAATGASFDACVLRAYEQRSIIIMKSCGPVRSRPVGRAAPAAKARIEAEAISSRVTHQRIRGIAEVFINAQLHAASVETRASVLLNFGADLASAWDVLTARIRRVLEQGEKASLRTMMSRKSVVAACAVLAIDPPSVGAPIDLKLARRRQRQLARSYHPDSNGGRETLRSDYEAVNTAYTTLEEYNESLVQLQSTNGEIENG